MTRPWTRVLVCGGREYGEIPVDYTWADVERAMHERAFLDEALSKVHARNPIGFLVSGGARGADRFALLWAGTHGVRGHAEKVCPDEWKRLGKRAGPIRNQRMIDLHKPDVVIAFPGGRGTADMCARATAAGIPVVRIGETT